MKLNDHDLEMWLVNVTVAPAVQTVGMMCRNNELGGVPPGLSMEYLSFINKPNKEYLLSDFFGLAHGPASGLQSS
jgi:hypothetical protein